MNASKSIAASQYPMRATACFDSGLHGDGNLRYDSRTSQEVGFGSPLEFAAKSRHCKVSGFFVGTSYGGADGRAQALPVFAPRVPRSSNLSALPPDLEVGRQSFNGTLEAIMAETLASTGTPAATSELSVFAPELTNIDGQITTTSIQVAQHFGKTHKSVLRAIRNLGCSAEFTQRNFAPCSRPGQNNKPEPYFRMTRDGFTFLAMGFTGKEADQWKEAYITAFNKMESEIVSLRNSANPAIDYARINPAQAQTLKELVQMVVESGKQSYGETWARLHNKFRVNSYLELSAQQFEDACDYLRAKAPQVPVLNMAQVTRSMEAANAVAAQVQSAVFEKLMTGNSRMGNGRWMLSFASGRDNTTVPCVTPIDDDAFVMSLAYLATAIVAPGGMMPSNTDLANLASACNRRLSARLTHEANQKEVTA